MIINSLRAPDMSLYFIGAQILYELKKGNENIELIYNSINNKHKNELSLDYFYLTIDWLFLINKVDLNGENLKIK